MPSQADIFNAAVRSGILSNPKFINAGLGTNTGLFLVFARMSVWRERFLDEMKEGMREWAKKVQSEMQQNATWQDRTGHARAALRAYLSGDDPDIPSFATASPPKPRLDKGDFVVIATGFMDYNQWLEIRWGGRFAVIWPTVVRNNAEWVRIMVDHGRRVS